MGTPEAGSLDQLAHRETLITQQAREAMEVLNLSKSLSRLSEKMLQNKEVGLASFIGMAAVVLLPRGIELANAVLGVNIDSTTASVLATQGLPVVAGALVGDYLSPITGTIRAIQQRRVLDAIRERGKVTPKELASVLARYPETVKPGELKNWVRYGQLSKEFEGDDRYEAITTLYDTTKVSRTPTEPETRKKRRAREKQLQDQTVELFMEGQIEGQRLRRAPSYVAKEIAKKVGDWAVGAWAMGGAAHVVNEVVRDATTAGSVGLIDDAASITALYLSPLAKRVLGMFKSEVHAPKGSNQQAVPTPMPVSSRPLLNQYGHTPISHIVNYNNRRL